MLALGLDEAHYWIYSSIEKVDFDKLVEAVGCKGDPECHVVMSPDDASLDYHVHLSAHVVKDEVRIHVVFYQDDINPHKHVDDVLEQVPAEGVFQWLGGFFKYESCQAHAHMHFIFPAAARASTVFPLPLRLPKMEGAEVDGFSINFPKRPQSVSKARLSLTEEAWYVETILDKKLVFKKASLFDDLRTSLSVIDSVLEVRKKP